MTDARRGRARHLPPTEIAHLMTVAQHELDGHPVIVAAPHGPAHGRFLYLHGGGHITEVSPLHWMFIATLIQSTGWEVVVPVFPLAPAGTAHVVHPFLQRVHREWLLDAQPSALIADSSGAVLAVSLLQRLAPGSRPPRTFLLSPWLDGVLDNPEIPAIQPRDPFSDRAQLRRFAALFAGGQDVSAPDVSPIRGDLSQLGRITIYAGSDDILTPDAHLFAAHAGPGTTVDLVEAPQRTHVWMLFSTEAAREVTADISSRLSGSSPLRR